MPFHFLLHPLENHEQGGHEKEQCQHAYQHTAHNTRSQRAIAVGSNTRGEHHRQQAHYHGECRHEDRAQTLLGCCDGGADKRHPFASSLRGKLGEQDGCLGEQADEHDETHLKIDVVLQSEQAHEEKTTHHARGYAQQHGKGDEPALVEHAQHDIDKHYGNGKDDAHASRILPLRARKTTEIVAIPLRQILACRFFYRPQRIARTVSVGSTSRGETPAIFALAASMLTSYCG